MKFYGILCLTIILCVFDFVNAKAQGPAERVFQGEYYSTNDENRKTYYALLEVVSGPTPVSSCTCNIIARDYVLTQTDCVDVPNYDPATHVRRVTITGSDGTRHIANVVESISLQDPANPNPEVRVNVVRVDPPFPNTGEFEPIALPPSTWQYDQFYNDDFTLGGYRDPDSTDDTSVSSAIVFYGDLNQYTRQDCLTIYSDLQTNEFCAIAQSDYAVCGADRGAALVHQDTDGNDAIFGILCRDQGCDNKISVFCFIPPLTNAITAIISEEF